MDAHENQPEELSSLPFNGAEQEDDTLSTDELEMLYQQALQASEVLDAFEFQIREQYPTTDSEQGTPATATTTATVDSPPASNVSTTFNSATRSAKTDVRPTQILEAALFVGGTTLTLKKLSRLLGEQTSEDIVEREIQTLNEKYASQGRPYEIVFGEGGYRMVLKSDFERIRNRAFGLGPKEIKLSQPLLEMLAFIAYRQPVSRTAIDELEASNASSLVSQLVRRNLVELKRTGEGQKAVEYSTTDRFLEVFGMKSLRELPHPDDFSFK